MRNVLTVKNTFLNFDIVNSPKASELNRASSDPLFETHFHDGDEEIVMTGLEDIDPIAEIVMTGLEEPEVAKSTGASTTGDENEDTTPVETRSSRSSSPRDGASDESDGAGETSQDLDALMQLKQEVERLSLENKRLEDSNRRLQDACYVPAFGAAQQAGYMVAKDPEAKEPEGQLVQGFMPTAFGAGQQAGYMVAKDPEAKEPEGQVVQGFMCFALPIVGQPMQPMPMQETMPMQDMAVVDNRREQNKTQPRTAAVPESQRTTVMLRNMPNNYTRTMLADLLDTNGFLGKYNFVYLPMDFTSCACLGYAFINLIDAADAPRFWSTFEGFSRWAIPSKKKCFVSWSSPHQGLQANLDRYKNSPVMHETVPEEFKPRLLVDGKDVAFPPATRKLRPPRLRR